MKITKKNKPGAGRPRKEIDMVLACELAKIHCTKEEIAAALKITYPTLIKSEEFNKMYDEEILHAKRSVRRRLWDLMMQKDDPKIALSAAIWQSKQYLHFSDRTKEDVTLQGGEIPIKTQEVLPVKQRIKIYEKIFKDSTA
jgi:hypothetical protein